MQLESMQGAQHAIAYEQFGPPSVLKYVEVPMPKRNPGEVLIRVQASSVNPLDYKVCINPRETDALLMRHCDSARLRL